MNGREDWDRVSKNLQKVFEILRSEGVRIGPYANSAVPGTNEQVGLVDEFSCAKLTPDFELHSTVLYEVRKGEYKICVYGEVNPDSEDGSTGVFVSLGCGKPIGTECDLIGVGWDILDDSVAEPVEDPWRAHIERKNGTFDWLWKSLLGVEVTPAGYPISRSDAERIIRRFASYFTRLFDTAEMNVQ